jgi:ubiquinone/menaquinone biosynthesis C-methylase UbiE
VTKQGLTNVEVIQADARYTGLPPASFDVAHARTVLVNVPDPGAVLADMTRLVRPGGWGWPAWSRTWPSTCITQPTPPGTDCMRSPSPPSKPLARTHSSAAVYRSCYARLASATSACERTPSFTRPATPVVLSVWTSCAAQHAAQDHRVGHRQRART